MTALNPIKERQDTCKHSIERHVWVEGEDNWGDASPTGHWETLTEMTYRDISTGAFQCTQCGKVGYYTGSWKRYYENGEDNGMQGLIDPTETKRTREAIHSGIVQPERKY